MKTTYKKTICPLDCPDSCGIVASVKDGRVTGLTGDKDHPYTNGFICRKMRRYPERLYGPERVLYPQLRIGPKGSGQFRRISWQEALEIAASRLTEIKKQYGGESILPYCYAGNMGAVSRFAGYPLFHKLGTSRLDQTICSAAAGAGWSKQCGDIPGTPPENAADAELIVAWGINIKVSNVHFWQYVVTARKKGARLLVIDPYRNQTAQAADSYLQVKPGGDSALALGVMKFLVEKDLLDRGMLGETTAGFEQQASYLNSCSWQTIVEESGIIKGEIEKFASLLARSAKSFIRIGIGLSRNSRGAMSVRSICSLAACLGLFSGGEGQGILLSSRAFSGEQEKLTYPSLLEKQTRTVNMIHLGHALNSLKPPIKSLIVYNSNPLSVNPDGGMVRQGLAREDLFTVVHEQVMSPTARYADLLLPATTFLENQDVYTGYGHFYLGVIEPVIEPVGEAWSNFAFFKKLAAEMGFTDPPFQQSCQERIVDYLLGMRGLPEDCSPEEILAGSLIHSTRSCKDGNVLACGTGRFHFVAPDPAPDPPIACLVSAGELQDPDLQARYPFQLITPPHEGMLNSTFGEFFAGQYGQVLIHPDDAAQYGVEDGKLVTLHNGRGNSVREAKLSRDTRQGLLVAEGIYWAVEPADAPESLEAIPGGINDLTSQKITDMGGGATFHECLVSLKRFE